MEKVSLEVGRVSINNITKEDPKRIISMAFPFDGDDIEVMRLSRIVSVKEKVLLPLPNVDNQRYYARLFSIQILKNGNRIERTIIEAAGNIGAAGNISSQVKLAAEKIVSVMLEKSMTSAFFPAYAFLSAPIMPIRCYIADSFGMFYLKTVPDINVRNIRILDSDNLLFTEGNRVMKIKVNDAINNRWQLSGIVYKEKGDILFLDRVQNNRVIATGDDFIVSIDLSSPSTSTALNHKEQAPHAFLRLKEFTAAVGGNKISLTPAFSR
ncbi:MAG: hypothetical protein AAB366_00345 [Patescibacteria group bacterium]